MRNYLSAIHCCFRRAENKFYAEMKSVPYIIVFIRKYPPFIAIAKTKLQNHVVYLTENNTDLRINQKNFFEYMRKIGYLLGYCFSEIFVLVFMFFLFICYYVREIALCIAYFVYCNICFYLSYMEKDDRNVVSTVMFKSLIYFSPYIFIALFSKTYIYDEFTTYNSHRSWVHPLNHVLPQHNLVILVFSIYILFFYL